MVRISMDTFVKRFQPEKYENWLKGLDVGPHPETAESNSKNSSPAQLNEKLRKK